LYSLSLLFFFFFQNIALSESKRCARVDGDGYPPPFLLWLPDSKGPFPYESFSFSTPGMPGGIDHRMRLPPHPLPYQETASVLDPVPSSRASLMKVLARKAEGSIRRMRFLFSPLLSLTFKAFRPIGIEVESLLVLP